MMQRVSASARGESEGREGGGGADRGGVPTKIEDAARPGPAHVGAPRGVVKGARKYVGNSAFVERD